MSDEMMVFGLVMVLFVVLVAGAGCWIKMLAGENRALRNELVLGYRRATMPVLGVPDVGEPDVPLTPAIKKAIDEAYGVETSPDDLAYQFAAGLEAGAGLSNYPDPTDGLLPNPDPTDGANRVSYGDDPFWPFQGGVEKF